MDIASVKQEIRDKLEIKAVSPPEKGGQSCGIVQSKQRLHSEELDLTIEFGYYKSNVKNRELIMTLFELVINEIVY